MANAETATVLEVLERLFVRQWRGLPQYLLQSGVWTGPDDEDASAALEEIATHHAEHARQLAELIQDRGGAVPHAGFPDRFTDANYHFVGIDYLLGELVGYQRSSLAAMVADCNGVADPEVRQMVDAILADERRDLQTLEALAEKHKRHLAEQR